MEGARPGVCMLWKPATRGVSAVVTVVAVDLDADRAQVHVCKASTGTCASHWVDLELLSEAPVGSRPCGCVKAVAPPPETHDAA